MKLKSNMLDAIAVGEREKKKVSFAKMLQCKNSGVPFCL